MPDISKCKGLFCKQKETCYRYTSKPDKYYQSYFATPPLKEDGTCEYYWGEKANSIYNQLNDIVQGSRTKNKKK